MSTRNAVRGKKGFQTIPLAERFWARVKKTDTCWLWQGATTHDGYGRIWVNGRQRLAHHVSMILAGRIIPPGLECDHLCRNPGCVNTSHIEPVTHSENGKRSPLMGRRGKANGRAKLMPEQVRAIRRLRGVVSQRNLAARFGIGRAQVWRIQLGHQWAMLEAGWMPTEERR